MFHLVNNLSKEVQEDHILYKSITGSMGICINLLHANNHVFNT